jgi:hypothetical protein
MSQITLSEGSAASTPASGKVVVYAKTDGLIYSKDDAGAETVLGEAYAPVTTTNATYTVTTALWLVVNYAGICTVTLPAASSFTGRAITIKTITANTVVSNASNVLPIDSASAGTAILAGTAGKWARLVSNGTNWVIMEAN